MNHSFDIDDAKKYGILAATILNNIKFWHAAAVANNHNFHEGKHWVYNTVDAWAVLFPYVTRDQVRRALETLRDNGAVITGVFNATKYDRTIWYSPSDPWANLPNQKVRFAQPIPNINTDINKTPLTPQRGEGSAEEQTQETIDFSIVVNAYHAELPELPKVQVLTDKRKRFIKQRWNDRKKAGKYTDNESAATYWRLFFKRIQESDLLMGRSTKWKADLEWIMTESHFVKIIEGAYHS